MKIIVLVKQVPDPEARVTVPQEGGSPPPLVEDRWVTSFFDEVALERALALRDEVGGEVVAVSAGPGKAADALRRAVAFGANRVAHLDDAALATADSLGIARALAAFVRAEAADLVLAGRVALDDDAGVVGPAVAELLGWPHAANVVEMDAVGRGASLRAVRTTDDGREALDLVLPALVTAQKGLAIPRVPPVTGVMRAMRAKIDRTDLPALGLVAGDVVPHVSVTSYRSPPARAPVRMIGGDQVEAVRTLAALLVNAGRGTRNAEPVDRPAGAARASARGDECWVIVEARGDSVRRASLEALGTAASTGCAPVAVVMGSDVSRVVEAVASHATTTIVAEHPSLADYSGETYARVAADLAAARRPRAILAGATALGRDLMARLSARLQCGYVADAVEVGEGDDGDLIAVRPILGGRAYARIAFLDAGPRLIGVRPNVFPPAPSRSRGEVERAAVSSALGPELPRVRVAARLPAPARRADLAEADVIVAGGRGVRGPEGFAVVERLAEALGAPVGASRAAVDAGWRDPDSQIGKSGRTVSPKLYVALGISGAVHHRMGMDTAGTVVVVNSDPEAPFFKHADYGIVGDLFEIAPALAGEILRLRRS